jgi:hypothetical protein
MAAPERLELPTVSFEGCRSIQTELWGRCSSVARTGKITTVAN